MSIEDENIQIEPGTVVWLKSGGPAMTVKSKTSKSSGYLWLCSWFVENKIEVKEHAFTVVQLTIEKPDTEILTLKLPNE